MTRGFIKSAGDPKGTGQVSRVLLVGLLFLLVWAMPLPLLRAEAIFSGPWLNPESGVRIEMVELLDRPAEYGFVPIRITVRNDSGKTRTWNFNFTSGGGYDEELSLKQMHSIEVEDGKTRTVDILLPLPSVRGSERTGRLQVNVTGFGISRSQAESQNNWLNYPTASVGLSSSLHTNYSGPLEEAVKKRGYPDLEKVDFNADFTGQRKKVISSGSDRELCATALDFSKIPADWRSYSSLAAVILTDQEWKDLPKAQEQALVDWMAIGGHLIVTGGGNEKKTVRVGFGLKTDLGIDGGITQTLAPQILALDIDPGFPWSADFAKGWGLKAAIGRLKVNTAMIIGFVVIFGIVVAPLNLFIFAPLRFRHRLFWTVPLISVVASVLLVAVIVLQEGFGGSGERVAVVLLLPEEHKMAVIQEQIVKTALLLSEGFPLSEKAIFAAVPINNESKPEGTVSRQGDQAGGDWFSSRTVRGFQFKSLLPTRSRVEMAGRSPDGAPIVVSSLPVNLKNFNWVDKNGKIWSLPELRTGERQTLQDKGDTIAALRTLVQSKVSGNLRQIILPMLGSPGFFFAEASDGGGIPVETLGSIRWNEDHVLYLGTWSGGEL